MAQNVEHWLFDLINFRWAQEHITEEKWYQIRKYFPGERLRQFASDKLGQEMTYVDAESGEFIPVAQYTHVPPGRVFIYGYDLHNFVGIDVPGMGRGTGPQHHPTLSQARAPRTPPSPENPDVGYRGHAE